MLGGLFGGDVSGPVHSTVGAFRDNAKVSSDLPPINAPGHVPAGLPGWKRAPCLGCDRQIVQARDGWVGIGGTRTGSYLLTWGAEPLLARATDPDRVPDEPLCLLGVAHHACVERARARFEAGTIALPGELPILDVEQGPHLPKLGYTLHLPPRPDACPFCDCTTGLTDEHVWPKWYSRDLQARGATLTGDNVRRGRIDLTVPVCGTCNHTWMSVLETDTGPLLTDMMRAGTGQSRPIRITLDQQARLATWAVKTAYLLDVQKQPTVPRGFLNEFALQRAPNESTIVWVAGYTPDVAARSEKRALDFLSRGGRTRNSPNGFVVTFTIFNVLFQIVGHFNGGPAVMSGGRRRGYEPALFRTWPAPSTDLTWPPDVAFSRTSWDDLTASITDGG